MKGRLWRLREHMAPLPSLYLNFLIKTAIRVCFCPLPFLKAFEEQADCARAGKARSAWAPPTVRACPTPTAVRARALGTYRLARPWHPVPGVRTRLWHPPPCARARALGTHSTQCFARPWHPLSCAWALGPPGGSTQTRWHRVAPWLGLERKNEHEKEKKWDWRLPSLDDTKPRGRCQGNR